MVVFVVYLLIILRMMFIAKFTGQHPSPLLEFTVISKHCDCGQTSIRAASGYTVLYHSLFFIVYNIYIYKGSGRGGLSTPPSSVVGNTLVVIDDGIESVNVKNRYSTKGHASQHGGQTVNRKMVFGGNLYMVE